MSILNVNDLTLDAATPDIALFTTPPDLQEGHSASTSSESSQRAGQRRLRAETQPLHANVQALNENPIPDWLLETYRKNKSLVEVISKSIDFVDVLALLKYHLYRPDEAGIICKSLFNRHGLSIELIKICLPSKKYLSQHPEFIDECLRLALKRNPPNQELISFFSNPEAVKNCQERNNYFVDWFHHEMRKRGGHEGESFLDFRSRMRFSDEEYRHFVYQCCPSEIQERLYYCNFINKQNVVHDFEDYYISVKYNLCKPIYYDEVAQDKNIWIDTFSNFLGMMSSNDSRSFELAKKLFPSREHRDLHPEKLDAYLDKIVWQAAHKGKYGHEEIALQLMHFFVEEGIDLQSIALKTRHPEISEFLRKHNFL